MGDESGAVAGLLQREVDELLVRAAGPKAAAAAHFSGESKGMELGKSRGRVGKSHTYAGTFPFASTSFRHGFFSEKKSFRLAYQRCS